MTMPASIAQTLREQLTAAVRDGETRRRDILRLLIAALDNARIAARHELSDEESIVALQREAKQRRDSIEQYRAGNREDLVQTEQEELDLITTYLPAELSDAELDDIVREVIVASGATGPADVGKVMGLVMKRVTGRAEGSRVSALARGLLVAQ